MITSNYLSGKASVKRLLKKPTPKLYFGSAHAELKSNAVCHLFPEDHTHSRATKYFDMEHPLTDITRDQFGDLTYAFEKLNLSEPSSAYFFANKIAVQYKLAQRSRDEGLTDLWESVSQKYFQTTVARLVDHYRLNEQRHLTTAFSMADIPRFLPVDAIPLVTVREIAKRSERLALGLMIFNNQQTVRLSGLSEREMELFGNIFTQRDDIKDLLSAKQLTPQGQALLHSFFTGIVHQALANPTNSREHQFWNDICKELAGCPISRLPRHPHLKGLFPQSMLKRILTLGGIVHMPGVRGIESPRARRRIEGSFTPNASVAVFSNQAVMDVSKQDNAWLVKALVAFIAGQFIPVRTFSDNAKQELMGTILEQVAPLKARLESTQAGSLPKRDQLALASFVRAIKTQYTHPESYRHDKPFWDELCTEFWAGNVDRLLEDMHLQGIDLEDRSRELSLKTLPGMDRVKKLVQEKIVYPYLTRQPHEPLALFYGRSGSGKTELAKSIGADLGIPFHYQSKGSLISKYVGESRQQIEAWIADVVAKGNHIVILDEFDDIAVDPAKTDPNTAYLVEPSNALRIALNDDLREKLLNAGIILIAISSHPDRIDPQIRNRFRLKIEFQAPDTETRREVSEVLLPETCLPADLKQQAKVREAFVEGTRNKDFRKIHYLADHLVNLAAQQPDGQLTLEFLRAFFNPSASWIAAKIEERLGNIDTTYFARREIKKVLSRKSNQLEVEEELGEIANNYTDAQDNDKQVGKLGKTQVKRHYASDSPYRRSRTSEAKEAMETGATVIGGLAAILGIVAGVKGLSGNSSSSDDFYDSPPGRNR